MQANYSEILNKVFKPKTKKDIEKVRELEKLMVEYIFIRIVEKMDEKSFKKIEKKEFDNLVDFVKYFRKEIPDFDKKLNGYINKFLGEYVRNK